ncbi:MAG: carboxypeptidase regulatory-like domain-containing protein [Rhizobacter sp.]
MKSSNWLAAGMLVGVLSLAACGGGGGSAGTSPFNSNAGTSTAADLDVVSSSAQLSNTPTSKVTVTVTAIDGDKRTVANAPVRISVASGSDAVVTQTTTSTSTSSGGSTSTTTTPTSVTNASGIATADVTVGANKANRSVTILATSGSITKSIVIQVVGATISSTVSAPVVEPGAQGSVRYRVVDQAKNPMANQQVQVSSAGLTGANPSGTTDLNGEYVFRYTAPAATGSYTITATAAGASNDQTVLVQPASTVPAAVGNITSASVSASPSVVPINATGSQNRTEIRALFLGDNNAPIANVRARFDLNGDPNSIGGTFNSGNAIIYSDANGFASSAYVPGARAQSDQWRDNSGVLRQN